MRAAFPGARIIAEDLGVLTPSVEDLLRATGLPGMAVLQFAFGGDAKNPYLPHNLRRNGVIYPGTHDNDTTLGWYATADEKTRDHVRRYLRVSGARSGLGPHPRGLLAREPDRRHSHAGHPQPRIRGALQHAGKARGQLAVEAVRRGRQARLRRRQPTDYLLELATLSGRAPPAGELLAKEGSDPS